MPRHNPHKPRGPMTVPEPVESDHVPAIIESPEAAPEQATETLKAATGSPETPAAAPETPAASPETPAAAPETHAAAPETPAAAPETPARGGDALQMATGHLTSRQRKLDRDREAARQRRAAKSKKAKPAREVADEGEDDDLEGDETRLTTPPPVLSPEERLKAAEVAAQTSVAVLITALHALGGPEFAPETVAGFDERDQLIVAFREYYLTRETSEPMPPGLALAVTVGMYIAPRLQRPPVQERLGRLLESSKAVLRRIFGR